MHELDGGVDKFGVPVGVPDEFMVTVDLPEGPSVLEFNSFSMRSTNFQIMVDHGNDEWSEYAPDAPRTYRGNPDVLCPPCSCRRNDTFITRCPVA